jgi:hypothetical protein
MRSQCHQHLICYEHTQQNTYVNVHGAHVHGHTRRHTQPRAHQHFIFSVVIFLGNATIQHKPKDIRYFRSKVPLNNSWLPCQNLTLQWTSQVGQTHSTTDRQYKINHKN